MPWYIAAVRNCQVVGLYLARFLDYLDSRGIPLSHVHVIGFSLGAEVAGFTGKHLRAGKAPRLPRITGEDYHFMQLNNMSRDSSVGIALGYGLDDRGSRVRFPAGAGNFSLHHRVQNGSGAHPASYPMGTRGSFLGGKAAGA
jgi:hypothetical protein